MNARCLALASLLAGCPRPAPPPPPTYLDPIAPDAPAADPGLGAAVGPGGWSGAGLVAEIPEGFAGHEGPSGTNLRLRVLHADSGAQVELWTWPRGPRPAPRPRPGCEPVFEDHGLHRGLPGLGPASTASCAYEDGRVVQGWYVGVAEAEVHVEVIHPPGSAFGGREVVRPMLESIRPAAGPTPPR